jgi:zinc protease
LKKNYRRKEDTFDASIAATTQKTPSSFDRTVEPEYGESPEVILLTVWKNAIIWYKINWN